MRCSTGIESATRPSSPEADAVVVRDVRVVEDPVQYLEQRQRVGEEALLQQPEHVFLGFDARFRHRDDADEFFVPGDCGVPAPCGVLAGEVRDDGDLEGLRARHTCISWKHRSVEVPDGDLADFRGGAFCHEQLTPFGALSDLGSESTGWVEAWTPRSAAAVR
jgi:hypothetical protein